MHKIIEWITFLLGEKYNIDCKLILAAQFDIKQVENVSNAMHVFIHSNNFDKLLNISQQNMSRYENFLLLHVNVA